MSYRIAVASSDGEKVDTHFGTAEEFRIYEVEDDKVSFVEIRKVENKISSDVESQNSGPAATGCNGTSDGGISLCSDRKGCGSGAGGCGNDPAIAAKIDVISDCRCVLAEKIGFQLQKQLEKRGIAHFDLDCGIQEAFEKLIPYFYKVDNHITLRNFAKKE